MSSPENLRNAVNNFNLSDGFSFDEFVIMLTGIAVFTIAGTIIACVWSARNEDHY